MGNVPSTGPVVPTPTPPQSPNTSLPPPPTNTSPPLTPPDLAPPPRSVPPTPVLEEDKSNEIHNPGTMEELHKQCKDVFPVMFEGGKFMTNLGLSNHFQVSHTINLSTSQPPGYRFGATFVGTRQVSPSEAYPVMLGDIDPSGNLNANIIHQFTPKLRAKFVAQIQKKKWEVTQLTGDWRGRTYTGSVTLGNLDLIGGSGVAVAHYLQQVTKKIALGTELAYQFGPQVPGGHIAVHSIAARYTGGNFTASGTLGGAGAHMCYYQKASDNLQLGVELDTNLRMQESVASIAYQLDVPKADLVFRGTVDSNWTVGAVLEKRLLPLPFTLALSGSLDHSKNQFKLGCACIIG